MRGAKHVLRHQILVFVSRGKFCRNIISERFYNSGPLINIFLNVSKDKAYRNKRNHAFKFNEK